MLILNENRFSIESSGRLNFDCNIKPMKKNKYDFFQPYRGFMDIWIFSYYLPFGNGKMFICNYNCCTAISIWSTNACKLYIFYRKISFSIFDLMIRSLFVMWLLPILNSFFFAARKMNRISLRDWNIEMWRPHCLAKRLLFWVPASQRLQMQSRINEWNNREIYSNVYNKTTFFFNFKYWFWCLWVRQQINR